MTQHRDYSHRDVLDKLGIKAGMRLAVDERAGALGEDLTRRIETRLDISPNRSELPYDIVLITADDSTDVTAALRAWRDRLAATGAIWLLTPKRGRPGYVSQDTLIPAGPEAGLVDNKICSVSDATSAMRFVIRRRDRPR